MAYANIAPSTVLATARLPHGINPALSLARAGEHLLRRITDRRGRHA